MKGKLEISYEGMGSLVEVNVKIDGKYVCTITSDSLKANKKTEEIIAGIEAYHNTKNEIANEIRLALMCGPLSELDQRLDKVFMKHFNQKFTEKVSK